MDQSVPFQTVACPPLLNATQNVLEAHETEERSSYPPLILLGIDQVSPFHINALPASSTATQNVTLGHELDAIIPVSTGESTAVGLDQFSTMFDVVVVIAIGIPDVASLLSTTITVRV